MKICLVGPDKTEKIIEFVMPENRNSSPYFPVADCYKTDSEENKIPIYIPRLDYIVTKNLCDYIFAKYKKVSSTDE